MPKSKSKPKARAFTLESQPQWTYGDAFRAGHPFWSVQWQMADVDGILYDGPTECLYVLNHQPLCKHLFPPTGAVGYRLFPAPGLKEDPPYTPLLPG